MPLRGDEHTASGPLGRSTFWKDGARRLCEPLGLDPAEGVVRVSALHYNTAAEIDRVIAVLDGVA